VASTQDYAILSLYVYDVREDDINRPNLPAGWTEIELKTDNFDGFSYGIFKGPGGEIVLAYTGTNEGIDWVSNITGGLGLGSVQASAAAVVFAQAREQYGANITLTGHSLGGGLASIMSVWFNRPAVVFDHAAFELAARNPLFVQASKVALALGGFELGEFLSYDGILNFATRELNVQGHHIEGEALQYLRASAPTIGGSDALSVGEGLDSVQLHSMALYVVAKMSPSFVQATLQSAYFLPAIVDTNLYNTSTKESSEKNFLIDLIRSEQAKIGNGKLSHFAADLHRLGQDLTGLNEAAQKAIVAQGVEWYYWQGTDYAGQEFSTRDGAVLQYTSAQGAHLPGALDRASSYVRPWLDALYTANTGDTRFAPMGTGFAQWNVATSATTGAVATARDLDKTQMFIGQSGNDTFNGGHRADVMFAGAGNDSLSGGNGNDMLYGGVGDDTLIGGGGNDWLYGGAGNDRYEFSGSFGSDTVLDADGQGSIWVSGVQLTGGEKLGANVWTDKQWTYYLTATGDLIISKADSNDRLIVRGWQSKDAKLGIDLKDAAAAPPPPTSNIVTGTQDADTLRGTAANDLIQGFAEDDWIDASQGGNDFIEAGSGRDFVGAGHGNDTIIGGTGRDVLFGRGGENEIWGGDKTDFDTVHNQTEAAADDEADMLSGVGGADTLYGGAGNDALFGGGGGDLIVAGAGNDNILADHHPGTTNVLNWQLERGIEVESDGSSSFVLTFINTNALYSPEPGNDIIFAGAGDDWVTAGAGDDIVEGGGDNDLVWGMAGDDVIVGGEGNDRLQGDGTYHSMSSLDYTPPAQHGNDTLYGGSGNDTLIGDGGDDTLFGGTGDDRLEGDAGQLEGQYHGHDYLEGEDGTDTLVGGGGNDTLYGGIDNDLMAGDASDLEGQYHGHDYLDGEDGTDTLVGGGGNDTLYGGIGNDLMAGDASDLEGQYHGHDYLNGEDGTDTLVGGGGNDTLYGGIGNDLMVGDASDLDGQHHGADYLDGEDGNDTLAGGGGNDTLYGGIGNDVMAGDASDLDGQHHGADYLNGEEGDDEIQGNGGNDTLLGGNGNDLLFGDDSVLTAGSHGNDYLDGEAGNDTLVGGAGSDTLIGGDGDDVLYGDADGLASGGDDRIYGDAGNDQMRGHQGNDTLDGGSGSDMLLGDEGDDVLTGGTGDDELQGGTGADLLFGEEGIDTLLGGADDDRLYGGADDDWLQGDSGNDHLDGGDGDDILMGGDGDDTLVGGKGFDQLFGGAGNDTYVFNANDTSTGLSEPAFVNDTSSVSRAAFVSDTSSDLALAEFVNDTVGVNHVVLNGMSISSMSLTPFGGFGGNDYILETGQSSILIRGLSTGAIGTVSVSGVTYTADQFFGKTYAWSADESTSTSGATLQGGKLADSLTATGGNSTLAGGFGNDILSGAGGNNTYLYEAGDGHDVIYDTSSAAQKGTLRFGSGISADQLQLSYSGDRLIVTFGTELAGSVEITGFNPNSAAASGGIARFEFKDGTILTREQLVGRGFDLVGSAASETVIGTNVSDRITGGSGDDLLVGKGGADTYVFNISDGTDTIADSDTAAGSGDILRFGEGIETGSVNALRNGNDVIFVIGSDQLTLRNYFTTGADTVERILFADGTEWSQANVNAVIAASSSLNFTLVGTEGENTLRALAGNDLLDGRGGNDTLFGGAGNDSLIGGAGYDWLYGQAGSDTYIVRPGDQTETISETGSNDPNGIDVVRFEGINRQDVAIARSGESLHVYSLNGQQFEAYVLDQFSTEDPAGRVERLEFADGTVLDANQIKAEILKASNGADTLFGFGGGDVVDGRWGADQIYGRAGNDTLQGSQGDDRLYGEAGDDLLLGGADHDYLSGGDGHDTLEGGAGWDTMDGGAGNDIYSFGIGAGMDIIQTDASGTDQVLLKAGITAANVTLHRVSSPPSGDIPFNGDSLVIQLNGGNDQLWIANYFATGTQGYIETIRFQDGTTWDYAAVASRLVSQGGTVNSMVGTTKANTFTVDHWNDTVTDSTSNDADLINAAVSYRLPNTAVWNLTLTGGLNLFTAGNDGSNILRGNSGDNWFNFSGLAGYADQVYGGRGDDVYVMASERQSVESNAPLTTFATISELPGEGNDTLVTGAWSLKLPDNIENLVLGQPNPLDELRYSAGASNDFTHRLHGNAANNIIDTTLYERQASSQTWYQFRNRPGFNGMLDFLLDGDTGADTLIGGQWNNIYVVDNLADVVIETGVSSSGLDISNDTVQTPFETSLLTHYQYIENITLTGNQAVRATGNARGNRLDGSQNTAVNILEGGDGDDTYVVGIGDVVIENGTGNDTFIAGSGPTGTTFSMAALGSIENGRVNRGAGALNLEGNDLDNWLTGNESDNTIWGGDGNDTISDQLLADILYTGKNNAVEIKPAFDSDLLIGGNGNDVITSLGGNDTMDGGAGDDSLIALYNTPRTLEIRFGADYGQDIFSADVAQTINVDMKSVNLRDVTLQRHNGMLTIETLDGSTLKIPDLHTIGGIWFSGGIVLSGSQIDAVIANPDRSVATEGSDLLVGTSGNDLITALGGFDSVYGLEGADALFGGNGNDSLFGGAGDDTLDGGSGDDLLAGGTGSDVYRFGRGYGWDYADDILLSAQGGLGMDDGAFDWVQFDASVTSADVRVLRQVRGTTASGIVVQIAATGDAIALQNAYAAGAAGQIEAVRFNGGTQWDLANLKTRIQGEAGYDNSDDRLTAPITSSFLDGRGGNDTLTGGSGNDTLDGGTGIDSMTGGAGNDTYYVDNTSDVVVEASRGGIDTVISRLNSYVLAAQVENLTLSEADQAYEGIGNALNNILRGNSYGNRLNGGAGIDTMVGEGGDDVYVVDNTADVVTEVAGGGIDTIESSVSIASLAQNVENVRLLGTANLNATGNAADNYLEGNAGANSLVGGLGNDTFFGGAGVDTLRGDAGDDYYIVDASDVVVETSGGGYDTVEVRFNYSLAAAADIERIVLQAGQGGLAVTGNGIANQIISRTDGNDTLNGGGGADWLIAGAGNDTLQDTTGNTVADGGEGDDILHLGAGNDFVAGGKGNDTLTLGAGSDVIGFNRGDGIDTVQVPLAGAGAGERNDAISVGQVLLSELMLSRTGNDLHLGVLGSSQELRLVGWYASTSHQTITKLQVVVDSTSDYSAGSTDVLRNSRILTLDFGRLVSAFDAASASNPALRSWQPSEATLVSTRLGSSNTQLLGGEVAYQYAQGQDLASLPFAATQVQVASTGFGNVTQDILNPSTQVGSRIQLMSMASFTTLASDSEAAVVEEPSQDSFVLFTELNPVLSAQPLLSQRAAAQPVELLQRKAPPASLGAVTMPSMPLTDQVHGRTVLIGSVTLDTVEVPLHPGATALTSGEVVDSAAESAGSPVLDNVSVIQKQQPGGLNEVVSKAPGQSDMSGEIATRSRPTDVDVVSGYEHSETPSQPVEATSSISAKADTTGRDELIAWLRTEVSSARTARAAAPSLMNQAWGQVDAWSALEQALAPAGLLSEAGLDGKAAFSEQQFTFTGASKMDITTPPNSVGRVEHVARFEAIQGL